MTQKFDTIIVGAGLAGLAAAVRLSQSGARVALVEARDRFGGRVHTRHDAAAGYPLEFGPEWFDDKGPVHDLLATKHHPMVAASGEHFRRIGHDLVNVDSFSDGGDSLHERLAAIGGRDISVGAALERCCAADGDDKKIDMLRRYVEGFHTADPDALSLAWWNEVEAVQSADASELRARHGLEWVVIELLRQIGPSCTVFLNTAVQSVTWATGSVTMECASNETFGVLEATNAVITLPLSILKLPPKAHGAVRFSPSLSAKRSALALLEMGPVVKINLTFDGPFWSEFPGLSRALFVQDFALPFPTWWSTLPIHAPIWVGWCAGPQVQRLGTSDPDAIAALATASLAQALNCPTGKVQQHLTGRHWHDWQRDPFAQGAYSWPRVGGANAFAELAEPLDRTLFFAGEATQGGGFNATMDGAILSGRRAAAEILATL